MAWKKEGPGPGEYAAGPDLRRTASTSPFILPGRGSRQSVSRSLRLPLSQLEPLPGDRRPSWNCWKPEFTKPPHGRGYRLGPCPPELDHLSITVRYINIMRLPRRFPSFEFIMRYMTKVPIGEKKVSSERKAGEKAKKKTRKP